MHTETQTLVWQPSHLQLSTGTHTTKGTQHDKQHMHIQLKLEVVIKMYLWVVTLNTTFGKKFVQNISIRVYLPIVYLLLYSGKLLIHGIYNSLLVVAEPTKFSHVNIYRTKIAKNTNNTMRSIKQKINYTLHKYRSHSQKNLFICSTFKI